MKRPIRLGFPLLVFGLPQCTSAPGPAATAPAPTTSGVRIDYVNETLPNGLRVVYHVDRSAPIVAVNSWYNVGSKHEQPGRTGLAHLYEHIMLFKGSRNVRDQERFALLEQAGGRAGVEINGTTSFDRTNYFQQVPSNQLELALWIEADHMRTAGEALTITVDGRPVAVLGPVGRRPQWLGRDELLRRLTAHQADPGLADDLAELAPGTTDDLALP